MPAEKRFACSTTGWGFTMNGFRDRGRRPAVVPSCGLGSMTTDDLEDVKLSGMVRAGWPPAASSIEPPIAAGPSPSISRNGTETAPPVIGKYVPLRELGVGAMGVVY